jgi:signal transduction histidine kinase/ActR/RegA family two-component response regulator
MTPLPPAGEDGDLQAREAELRRREELLGVRETMLEAMTEFRQTQSDALTTQLRDGRDANAQLVVTSLRLQALAEAAEKASLRKDEFLAMLSHELRNPLAPMHNVIEILGRISGAEPSLPWIHGVLDRQVGQLTRLLDDLLDAARVRTGKLVLRRQRVAVRTFIEQAVETCRSLAEARGQALTVHLPDAAVWVDGDPARLTQVFTNLLNNASKYTQQGGTIDVRVQAGHAKLTVSVIDNGCGLTAEALPRIFELFAQEDQSLAHAQGGLGIGLAVVRELVHLHGGSVRAVSAGPGQGCEFVVDLPLMADVTLSAAPSPAVTIPPPPEAAPPLSIVLIEDNVDANQSLAAVLQMAGHEVVSAYDGPAGATLALAIAPQVVLCDLGLPGMDGLQVATLLRNSSAEPRPMLVALTGYGLAGDLERSKAAGFDAHLVKPVDPRALLALLKQEAERLAQA